MNQEELTPPVVIQTLDSSDGVYLKSEIAGPLKRKKVPLRPGHSLVDWIRLYRENPGIAKVTRQSPGDPVADEELSLHNSRTDCWIALRGKVYNVTPYLDFHPGGADEIMRAAGQDATNFFNEIHAWVNYESLLRACLIGTYAGRKSTLATDGQSSAIINKGFSNTLNALPK